MQSSTQPNQKQVILFIPFSSGENNGPLNKIALLWQENYRLANKPLPTIVRYEQASLPSKMPTKAFTEDTLPPNCAVFILMHGIGDPRWVVNTAQPTEEAYRLPIELVANRFKEMGFEEKLVKNVRSIHLFACEEATDSTKSLAIHFAHALGKEFSDLLINYYSAIIYGPCTTSFNKEIKTRATLVNWHETSEQLFQKKIFQRASKFKNGMLVGEALEQNTLPFDHRAELCLRTAKAINPDAIRHLWCALFQFITTKTETNGTDSQPHLKKTG